MPEIAARRVELRIQTNLATKQETKPGIESCTRLKFSFTQLVGFMWNDPIAIQKSSPDSKNLVSILEIWHRFDTFWSLFLEKTLDSVKNRSIRAFRFRVGLKHFYTADEQYLTIRELRRICDKYPEYDLSTYGWWWQFADQYEIVLKNTLQNVAIALGCMIVISLLFIPEWICTVWITLAIISIDLGVVGFMAWWNVNLDAISMITIIMSIGFSVDFTCKYSCA